MSSLAAKLLKAKAALGLDDDDAPAKEPKGKPKQHRVDGGIDKSKKKVRLNARQKAKAAGKTKKPRHAPVEGDRADRRKKALAAAKAGNKGGGGADEDEGGDIEEDTGDDDDDDGGGGGGGGGKTAAVGSSSVAEELVKLAQEAKEAQAAAVASSRKSKPSADKAAGPLPTTRWTVFLNQLPYTVTQRDIAGHMAAAAGIGPEALTPFVRMCQRDGQFTGSAFVDVPDEAAYWRALQLHHQEITCADGRRRSVNVRAALVRNKLEVKRGAVEAQGQAQGQVAVAGGSGGSGIEAAVARAEAEAAAAGGDEAGDAKPKDARTLVREAVAAGRMRQGDLDERALEFLVKAEPGVAKLAIEEFCELSQGDGLSNITNKSSFFMGLLRERISGKKNADHEMTGASLAGGTQESWSYPKNQGLTTKEKEREPMPSGAGGKGGKGESGKGKGKDGGKGKGKGKGKAGKGKGKGHGMTHGKPQVVGDGVRGKISGPNKGVIKVAPKRAVDSARPSWLD